MADTELLPGLFYININLHFPGSSPEVTRDNASQKTATLKDVGNYATKRQVLGSRQIKQSCTQSEMKSIQRYNRNLTCISLPIAFLIITSPEGICT